MRPGLIACTLALVGFSATAHASEAERLLLLADEAAHVGSAIAGGGPATKWEFDLDLILWLPISMNGTSTVNGTTVPINFDLDDILNLLEIGGEVRVEAWRGKWGIIVDAMYLSLGTEGVIPTPGPGSPTGKVDIQEWSVDFAAAYRVLKTEEQNTTVVDLIFGARYVDLKQAVDLTPPGTTLGGSFNWLAIFFGARFATKLNERWMLMIRGDVGGFGIGSGSELTWNILFGFGYQFGKERRPGRRANSLRFGWRFYEIDYLRGSGTDAFGMDALMHGPFLAFGFQF